MERLSPIDRISHLHELIQITLYIHRHKMKNWIYLCILLLLTLASRGETFSSSVLVGLNLTFVKLLNTSGTKQNGSSLILPKMSQLSITSKQRIPAKSSLLYFVFISSLHYKHRAFFLIWLNVRDSQFKTGVLFGVGKQHVYGVIGFSFFLLPCEFML